MTNGWIKLHRTLLDKAIFMNPHALQVFLYCLMKATYKDMKLAVGNRVIYLKPGQLLYGRKRVSQRLGMGEGKLRGVMDYLEQNGTITIERHSQYSIVTIVNWEQYQNGEGVPDIPFDCDFFEDDETEPPCSHPAVQSANSFADSVCELSATFEPQYNNINNKIKENKIINHKTAETIQNMENANPLFRQTADIADDLNMQKGSRGYISQDAYPSAGERFTKGEGEALPAANPPGAVEPYSADDAEAFAALSTLDEALLDAYFASCDYAQFEPAVLAEDEKSCFHDFPAEMVYALTDEEAEQAEALFNGETILSASARNSNNERAASIDEIDPYEQTYIAAHQMFEHLWKLYPVKAGKEKVSEAQIMYLYEEIGEKRMKQAIRRYLDKKHRIPKKYWQNGSTFFNGGYEEYLPEVTYCSEKYAVQ